MYAPDEAVIDAALDPVAFPTFVDVRYDPPQPELDDPTATASRELDRLPLDSLPPDSTVAIGVGSRGISDIVPIVEAVVDGLRSRDFDPLIVPAMGSHGGATAEGQHQTLAALGLTEARLGCPIDSRMDATRIGETELGQSVFTADAALDADAILVVNRVKPHTSFEGPIESGLCKMAVVGLGKRPGAAAYHETAVVEGYVEALTTAFEIVRTETPLLGGVGIVENAAERTATVRGIPTDDLPDAETELLSMAKSGLATLPFDDLDLLVIDEIGKDVSGTGMDTNVVARTPMLGASGPETPEIKRIFVRGVTDATHGNAHGIGLADLTTTAVIERLDLDAMYTNALTSGSLELDRIPMALPTDELALRAAVSTIGPYDPETVRIAWIQDTLSLSRFRISDGLAEDVIDADQSPKADRFTIEGRSRLVFEDGSASFEDGDEAFEDGNASFEDGNEAFEDGNEAFEPE